MGTSIGAATDWLVANFTTAIGAVDPTAVVGDNLPSANAPGMVVVGRTMPTDFQGVTGTQQPVVLGLGKNEEDYSIPCFAIADRPGTAQKPSRDAAIVLFDACAHAVAQDRELGGALLEGRHAWIDNIRISQMQGTAKDGGALCSTLIQFDVHCRNHYLA